MKVMFISALMVLCLVILSISSAAGDCEFENATYPEGEFSPYPCSPCYCYKGKVSCAIVDCPPPPCFDSVQGECCRDCPNGINCLAPDGTLIPEGQSVQIDSRNCSCSILPYREYLFADCDDVASEMNWADE